MAAVLAGRRAVTRLDTRATLVVAAIAWVITRVPMYLLDEGIVHLRWQARFVGDILIYQQWLPFFAHGRFPAADPRWQYPPGAGAVLTVPHLLPGSYAGMFFVVEMVCDLVITALLARLAIRHGSWLGCWCWLVGIPLLGPVVFGHFDIAATLLAVAALYLADSPGGLGAFAGLGAVVKVWPLAVLVGARPGQASKAVTAAIATTGVIAGGYLTFTHGSLSFLANKDSRASRSSPSPRSRSWFCGCSGCGMATSPTSTARSRSAAPASASPPQSCWPAPCWRSFSWPGGAGACPGDPRPSGTPHWLPRCCS